MNFHMVILGESSLTSPFLFQKMSLTCVFLILSHARLSYANTTDVVNCYLFFSTSS